MFPICRRRFLFRLPALLALSPGLLATETITYAVRKGDSLSRIALRYGTSVRELKRINHLDSDLIRIGQKLAIPRASEALASVRAATKQAKLDVRKWKYIVAHHSATPHGNAASYARVHRSHGMKGGLAYHFVIGNGRDSGDGEIEIGDRWLNQLHGGHVSKWEYNNHGIGICLVGNFEAARPTRKQLDSFKLLVAYLGEDLLQGEFKFLVHKEINATLRPGRHFPTREMHRLFG